MNTYVSACKLMYEASVKSYYERGWLEKLLCWKFRCVAEV